MAYVPRSSFIPKDAPGAIPQHMRKKTTIRIFNLGATILLTASFFAAVGSYFYEGYSEKQLATAKVALESAARDEDESKMAEIRSYNAKLNMAWDVLDAHIAPSRIFSIIEDFTKSTVQFSSFEFTYEPRYEALVTLSGSTESFGSVVLQKMQLRKDSVFSEFVVESITNAQSTSVDTSEDAPAKTDEDEEITFNVTGVFLDKELAYRGSEIELAQPPASEGQVVADEATRSADEPVNAVTE